MDLVLHWLCYQIREWCNRSQDHIHLGIKYMYVRCNLQWFHCFRNERVGDAQQLGSVVAEAQLLPLLSHLLS